MISFMMLKMQGKDQRFLDVGSGGQLGLLTAQHDGILCDAGILQLICDVETKILACAITHKTVY